jgi:hypothetical protein
MNFISIKKILLIFILFTSTTFINVAFALDGWFSPDRARCKVEYTRLDLVTGIETHKKTTSQYYDEDSLEDNCDMYNIYLADKVKSWLMEDKKNIIVDMSFMYCKTRTDDGIFSNVWTEYEQCDAYDSAEILRSTEAFMYIKEQRGYNAHKLRLKELVQE